MIRGLVVFVILLAMHALGGCSDRKARELYETARFEELQNNDLYAARLYREILEKYPETETAQKARERLEAMK